METLVVKIKIRIKFLEIEKEKKIEGLSKKRKQALIKGFKELKLVEEGKLKGKPASEIFKKIRNEKS
jgi:hypothetical protein